jgi:hypothetical protein
MLFVIYIPLLFIKPSLAKYVVGLCIHNDSHRGVMELSET